MSASLRVTVFIDGNEDGYYQDARGMGEHVRRWINQALDDRDDIQSWSISVESEEKA